MFKKLDMTSRPLRSVQRETLDWIENHWDDYDTFVLDLVVGSGKSLISRAIQLETGGHIITPSNYLLNQYRETYKKVNFLQGMDHYVCQNGMSCGDNLKVLERRPCEHCPYMSNKARVEAGEPSFLNPMSYNTVQIGRKRAVIIDECHTVPGMLLELSGYTFTSKYYTFPAKLDNEVDVINWIRSEFDKLQKLIEVAKEKDKINILSRAVNLRNRIEPTLRAMLLEPEKYHIDYDKKNGTLKVLPLFVPESISAPYKTADKIFLLSGTITDESIRTLGKGRVGRFTPKSPISVENRQVIFDPPSFSLNDKTKPEVLAEVIKDAVRKYRTKNENTLIHVPYKWQDRLKPYLPSDWITNDKKSKERSIKQFKKQGGIFLSSGCAEGVDFPYDECRLNIIPILTKPNIGDSYVKKRLTLSDGKEWYNSQILVNTAQKIGRSTRGENDFSLTIITDSYYSSVVAMNQHLLNSDLYINNVKWSKQND